MLLNDPNQCHQDYGDENDCRTDGDSYQDVVPQEGQTAKGHGWNCDGMASLAPTTK